MSDGDIETNKPESTGAGAEVEAAAAEETKQQQEEQTRQATARAAASVEQSLLRVGFVNFDAAATDNTTTGAMVSADLRQHFRRDVYVGIRDREQSAEFLGRI